jgi:hypothetical protein
VDVAGNELCLKFAGAMPGQCRFGAECHRSHAAPSAASLERIRRLMATRQIEAEAAAQARLAEATVALHAPLPDWLHFSRTQLVFSTSSSAHYERMRVAVSRFLGAGGEPGVDDGELGLTLSELHTLPPEQHRQPALCPTLVSAYVRAGMPLPATWGGGDERKLSRRAKKELKIALAERQRSFEQSEDYLEYIEAFKAFVAETVAPLCGDPSGIVFQCPPSLRVHMPGKAPTIGIHCDADYEHHQSAEINFWVPFTDVFGRCAKDQR